MLHPVMAASSDSFQLVSVAEACRILSVSDSTIRRLLRAGRLEAQKVQRPQGHVWLVKVPAPTGTLSDEAPQQLGATDGQPPGPPALAAWMTSVLEPLVAELGTSRQRIEHLARENGRLSVELEMLRAQPSPQDAPTAPAAPEPSVWPPVLRGRSWAVYSVIGVLVVVLLSVVAVIVHLEMMIR
jgi:excisionase family DNA binding protein